MTIDDARALWGAVTEPWRSRPGVSFATMMGLPFLRLSGAFVAAWDRRTGDLLVKLPAYRVTALVGAGDAHPFAPAGRRFREWAAIPPDQPDAWTALLEEAIDHAVAAAEA